MSTILNDLAERTAKARGMWALNSLWTEIESASLTPEDKATLHAAVTARVAQERDFVAEVAPEATVLPPWVNAPV